MQQTSPDDAIAGAQAGTSRPPIRSPLRASHTNRPAHVRGSASSRGIPERPTASPCLQAVARRNATRLGQRGALGQAWTGILLVLLGWGFADAVAFAAPERPTLPILAWLGPPANETTSARYGELAEAGFTHSFSGFPEAAAMTRALDVAHEAGVKLMISCPELRRDPEATVRQFINHPAVGGYYLRDEPNAADFEELGAWVRRIRAVDETHPCYINLFPTYASATQLGTATYREHVARFLETVPVQVLSFDHYPIVGDQLRADYYENLEIIAEAARKADKPFWAFALAVAHDPYPVATVEGLRLQVFSDLAYGAQAIQYFTYWTPRSSQWNFHTAPLEADGTRTAVYDRVKQVNAEAQALAAVFVGVKVRAVGHLGPLPQGTRPLVPEAPLIGLDTGGRGAVVSRLHQGDREFLVIVNRDLREAMTLHLQFEPDASIDHWHKTGIWTTLANENFSDQVEPGDLRVFRWSP